MTLTYILEIICSEFNQNLLIRLGCRDDTHAHTDTHTLASIITYSVKMTEYNDNSKSNDWILIPFPVNECIIQQL